MDGGDSHPELLTGPLPIPHNLWHLEENWGLSGEQPLYSWSNIHNQHNLKAEFTFPEHHKSITVGYCHS